MRRLAPDLSRPHRTIGYPFTVYVFAAVSIGIVVTYGITRPGKTLFSLGLIALALPVYALGGRSSTL
jgi:APA family basic amino acid/polyamine antiporter